MTMRMCAAAVAAVGMLGVAGMATSASATIIIDDFTSADPGAWPTTLNAVGDVTVNENGLNTLGGTRKTYIEATSITIPSLDFLQVAIAPAAGLFDYNSTVGADGNLSLLYDGGGSLNANFSAMNAIEISFAMFDYAGMAPLPVTIHLSDGANTATHTLALNAPGGQILLFDFMAFSGIGSVDLSSLQSIQMDMDPAIGADFRIDHIMAVPAPGALALLGLGLIATRRRRE